MATPAPKPDSEPSSTPLASSQNECSRLSPRRGQSSRYTSISACGGAKNGTGNSTSLAVTSSHAASSNGSATSHLPAGRSQSARRAAGPGSSAVSARATATPPVPATSSRV